MAFVLEITDGNETANFMGTALKVDEGGFNISLPRKRVDLALYRPGPFFVPLKTPDTHREATIKFTSIGATRTAVLDNIEVIERILSRAAARAQVGRGDRVELKYKWDGATNTTYWEVYGGQVNMPSDVLSVGKVHRKNVDGNYALPECELTLYISPKGYTVDILSGSPTAVELYNSYAGPSTGYIDIRNYKQGYTIPPYVTVDASELPGSEPYITKLYIDTNYASFYAFNYLYMGLYEGTTVGAWYEGSGTVDSNCSGGEYDDITWNGPVGVWDLPTISWTGIGGVGSILYYFLVARDYLPQNTFFTVGYGYSVNDKWKLRTLGDFNTPKSASVRYLPLGPLAHPPNLELADIGTVEDSMEVGIYGGYETTPTDWTLDLMYGINITHGMRIWQNRGCDTAELKGYCIDDGWMGMLYFQDPSTSKVRQPLVSYLEPFKLAPNKQQTITFFSYDINGSLTEHYGRQMKVKMEVVPTVSTLAV